MCSKFQWVSGQASRYSMRYVGLRCDEVCLPPMGLKSCMSVFDQTCRSQIMKIGLHGFLIRQVGLRCVSDNKNIFVNSLCATYKPDIESDQLVKVIVHHFRKIGGCLDGH